MIAATPDVKTATIDELAEWWASNLTQIAEWDSLMWHAKRRLREAIRDMGPLQTKAGKLAIATDKFDYPEEIAQEFPTLGKHVVTAKVETLAQAEQALELILELIPNAEVDHLMKVDGRLAASYLKTASPEQGAKLLSLRQPAGKLELR